MATTDETAPVEEGEQAAASRRPSWNLNQDDKRLLLITIVGGLVANIGLVVIVGFGLLEAHLIHRYRHSLATFFAPQLVTIGIIAGSILISWVSQRAMRREHARGDRRKHPRPPGLWIEVRITIGLVVLGATMLILGLVGYAAGLK